MLVLEAQPLFALLGRLGGLDLLGPAELRYETDEHVSS